MADVANASTSRTGSEPSTAELVQRATEQVSRLVRDELALARAELTQKGKHAGIGIGLFGGGGVLAVLRAGRAGRHGDPAAGPGDARGLAALIVAVALFRSPASSPWSARSRSARRSRRCRRRRSAASGRTWTPSPPR